MKQHSLLTGLRQLPFFLIAFAGLLAVPALSAEPESAPTGILGVSSIPVRFSPPQDKTCSTWPSPKFKDGKFLGYVDLLAPHIEHFLVDADHRNYEAELGWAEKDGKYGFLSDYLRRSQGFLADESFRGLSASQYLGRWARAPARLLAPFRCLLRHGRRGNSDQDAKPGDVRDIIRGNFQVTSFSWPFRN